MNKSTLISLLGLAVLLMIPPARSAEPVEVPPPKRVLLVTGIDYPGHPWRETAPAIRQLLEQDPRLRVTVIEDPHFLDSPAVAGFDVILLHFMNWEQPSPGKNARANLQHLIENGTGLMLVHFACGAWQDWPEFKNLAGRVWDPKLRAHDPRGPFKVDIVDPDHPITRGLNSFETDDELYTCLTGDLPVHVIASAKSKVDAIDYPMAFVFNHGKGRVFHTVLGHDLRAVTNSAVPELLRRGCAWSAGLPPQP
jgi:type 1 glutamine amidotransferase